MQSVHNIGAADKLFEGVVHYQVAHSTCAPLSQNPWVVMDAGSAGASSSSPDDSNGMPEPEEMVTEPEGSDGGGDEEEEFNESIE